MGLLKAIARWQEAQRPAQAARLERAKARSRAADADLQEVRQAQAALARLRSFDCRMGDVRLEAGELTYPAASRRGRVSVAGATAEYSAGMPSKRITATRVGAGAVLFGPLGAVVGGALRKDETKVYVTITTLAGQVVIAEAGRKEEAAARGFAAKVNAAGEYFAEREALQP